MNEWEGSNDWSETSIVEVKEWETDYFMNEETRDQLRLIGWWGMVTIEKPNDIKMRNPMRLMGQVRIGSK